MILAPVGIMPLALVVQWQQPKNGKEVREETEKKSGRVHKEKKKM